jgi:AcrR family transcriptional regulator
MVHVGSSSTGDGTRVPAGRRERRKATTRQDLIAAGRRLFGSRGLYESRIEDLAETAGVAKGTFYQYFTGKEHLVLAVVQDALAGLTKSVERRCAGTRSLFPGVSLRSEGRQELALAVFGGVSGALSVRVASWPGRPLPRSWPRLNRGYAALARSYAVRRST